MNTSAEAADQIVRMTLNGTETAFKITGAAAERIGKLLYNLIKDLAKETKKTSGKMRLSNLIKSGSKLDVFDIDSNNLEKFCELAKSYGLTYTIIREKDNSSGLTEILVKNEDLSKMRAIFRRLNMVLESQGTIEATEDKEKQEHERISLENTDPDKFLTELMKDSPNKEETEAADPSPARTEKSPDRSVPSSEHSDADVSEPGRKPSVRAQLEKFREEEKAADRKDTIPTKDDMPLSNEHIPVKKKEIKVKECE